MGHTVLVVEDEPSIADNISYALKTEGFTMVWAENGKKALDALKKNDTEIAVLDIGLPDINGFELFHALKKIKDIPVIFLTARSDEIDRVTGLEMGGDDYIVKPFSPRELTARIKAVLRRGHKNISHETESECRDCPHTFSLNTSKMLICYENNPLNLSRYEFLILKLLLSRPGRVFSRQQLMELVWDDPYISDERTVDTHIKTIRNKLKEINPDKNPIVTHRGFGYSLKESE